MEYHLPTINNETGTCYNTDGLEDTVQVEVSKQPKGTNMKCLDQTNSQRQKVKKWLPGIENMGGTVE